MNKQHKHYQNRAKRNVLYGGEMPKMNEEVYALRRNVINTLYEIKKVIPNLPRQVIRIVDLSKTGRATCAYAGMGDNFIHVTTKWAGKHKRLYELVAHELCHSVAGIEHDDNCPLMSPTLNTTPLSKDVVNSLLKKYLKNWM